MDTFRSYQSVSTPNKFHNLTFTPLCIRLLFASASDSGEVLNNMCQKELLSTPGGSGLQLSVFPQI